MGAGIPKKPIQQTAYPTAARGLMLQGCNHSSTGYWLLAEIIILWYVTNHGAQSIKMAK